MLSARSLLVGFATIALTASGSQAADLLIGGVDPIYDSGLFNFEGFYVGGSLGVGAFPGTGTAGTVGVVAGANFELSDAMLAGLEFQGDAVWNGGGMTGVNALLLGKLGGYLGDETMIYGSGGAGWVDSDPSYALGVGIEQAIADQVSVRGEAMATGSFGGWFDGGKAAVSLLWHVE